MCSTQKGKALNSHPAINIFKNPVDLIATGFGSGLFPFAPGTMGTLVAVPFYLLCQRLSWPWYLAITMMGFILGCWICEVTANKIGENDPGCIVWDEIVGYFVTMSVAPIGWLWIGLGFAFFRVIDILKPWPISWLERHLKGGFGIMLDDVVAGVIAAALLSIFAYMVFA